MGHPLSGVLSFPRRIATTYLNAAVYPVHRDFFTAVQGSLAQKGIAVPIRILKPDGGNMNMATSLDYPAQTILSGPSASVMGAIAYARADESCLTLSEYHEIKNRYQVINIKLDKTGGLTEALRIVKAAKADGKKLMVGNMTGSSLSMAPAYVIGQFCDFVDIDGPLLLDKDVEHGLQYLDGGVVGLPQEELWG